MVSIVHGDITQLKVDAIVNAANNELTAGSGVSGAIHRAAGSDMDAICQRIAHCDTGEACITPGFRLPAKHVIHAVGPAWQGGKHGEPELLAACYHNALMLALRNEIRSIAFPCISTGIYGYPQDEAAHIALHEILSLENRFEEVIVCCFEREDEKIYLDLLASH